MYQATPIIFAVMGATTIVSMYALLQLRRSPPSHPRNMATAVLAVLVITATVFFLSYGGALSPAMTALVVAPQVMSIWVSAFLLHLILLFYRKDGNALRPPAVALVWSSAIFITALVAGVAALSPGTFSPGEPADFYHVHFGSLGPIIAAAGAGYLIVSLTVLALLLGSGAAGARREMSLTFALLALAFFDAPLLLWPLPGLPEAVVPLMFQSLTGVALAYAVMRECPLVVPRREPKADAAPGKRRFSPGTTHLCLHRERHAARSAFASMVGSGALGLWVTRQHPHEGRKNLGLVNTPFIWLTSATVEGEVCIGPADTGRLSKAFLDFLAAAEDCIILFEGLEYITSNIGFKSALNLLQFLNDRVMGSRGVLLVSLDPGAFRPEELALLRSESSAVHDEDEARCEPVLEKAGAPAAAG